MIVNHWMHAKYWFGTIKTKKNPYKNQFKPKNPNKNPVILVSLKKPLVFDFFEKTKKTNNPDRNCFYCLRSDVLL